MENREYIKTVLQKRFGHYLTARKRKTDASFLEKVGYRVDQALHRDIPEHVDDTTTPLEEQKSLIKQLSRISRLCFFDDLFMRRLAPLIQKAHAKHPARPVRILDVGAGGGGFFKALYRWTRSHRIEVELYGIDYSEHFLKMVEGDLDLEGIFVNMIRGDARRLHELDLPDIDIAISRNMVHHVRDAGDVGLFLSELYRIGREGFLVMDIDRTILGCMVMPMGVFLLEPFKLIVDGIRSVRRAYRTSEIQFMAEEVKSLVQSKGSFKVTRTSFYPLPMWFVAGSREPVSDPIMARAARSEAPLGPTTRAIS